MEGCGSMVISFKKLAFIIILITVGFLGSSCNNEEVPTVEEVDLTDELTEVEAFGVVKADESKDIIIDFPAKVQDVLVEEGQKVSLNEPIITLDLQDYRNLLRDKNNELSIARLEYQRANSGLKGLTVDNVDIELESLNSDMELAKKAYEKTLEDYNSNETLYSVGGISLEALQQSKLALDEAQHKIEAIEYEQQLTNSRYEEELKQLNNKQGTERYQVSIQNERIKQVQNEIATLQNKVNKSFIVDGKIVSEFENGAVYDINFTPGSIVSSATKVFTIVNLNSLIIEANVVEEFIRDVKLDSSVRIVPIADRAREYTGKVINISHMAFSNNGETQIPIRISIDNLDSFLLPNYNVDIFIDVR